MEDMIRMTKTGQKRLKILELVIAGSITLAEAGEKMGISYRQAIRIMKKYRIKGDEALNHGLIGRKSNNRKNEGLRNFVIEKYKTRYPDFGPTLASEKLYEEFGIEVNHETLRLWLIEEGSWLKRRERAKHRRKRPRKECFGEMIQIDGSFHHWFEDDRQDCLMEFVDDATCRTLALFDTGETTYISLKVLYLWIEKYGIPESLYSDKKSVFYTERKTTLAEQLEGIEPMTEFGRVCSKLGIKIIYANSAQAKGRVERKHGVQQDRLVKELRLKGIKDIEMANKLLLETYLNKHNAKFSKPAAKDEDMHVKLLPNQDLRKLICFEILRKVDNSFVVRNDNHYYQLARESAKYVSPKNKVQFQIWLDGSIHIFHKDRELKFYEIDSKGNRVAA
jgi:transposase